MEAVKAETPREMSLSLMRAQLAQLANKRDNLKDQLSLFRLRTNHPCRHLQIWHRYTKVCVDHDRLYQAIVAVEHGYKNHWGAKPPKPSVEEIPVAQREHIETRLDVLPDLCLIRIAQELVDVSDVRALFWAIPFKRQVERKFCNRVRECLELRGLVGEMFPGCSEASGWCRFPTMCPRCFLYGKGRCLRCDNSAEQRFEEHHNTLMGCDGMVSTEATGIAVTCREQIWCPTCRFMYHPDEADEVVRIRDFDCEKYKTRQGCIKCTVECKWCANIGCDHRWHYRVNPDVYTRSTEWPECKDCHHSHCCSLFVWYTNDDGKLDFDWDNLRCPVWEDATLEIPKKKLKPPPEPAEKPEQRRRILKVPNRTKVNDTCPSVAGNDHGPADCTSHSESQTVGQ